jgi:hypothetical protein
VRKKGRASLAEGTDLGHILAVSDPWAVFFSSLREEGDEGEKSWEKEPVAEAMRVLEGLEQRMRARLHRGRF